MKITIIMLFALSIGTAAISQNTLTGVVTSEIDNQPLPASIYLPQLELGTDADLDGNFNVRGIPKGSYTVVCSFLGFATVSRKVNFSEDEAVKIEFRLKESVVEMETVIISTPFHKLQGENVMKVERMSASELATEGLTTLAEGITAIPGVESISTGLGIGKPVIRGLSANRVLVYAQGVRLENQQFGDEHGLGVNQAGVESVEVIKGPASLLYGSDALGGVLYLNPEQFEASGETTADSNLRYFSNTRGYSVNAGAKTSGERLKFLARIARDSHSDYMSGDGIRVTNSRFNETDLTAGLRYQNRGLKSTFRYNYNRANIGIPEEIGEQNTNKELLAPYQEIDNHILSLENNFYFNESRLDIKLGYLFNDRREFEESESPALQLKLNTLNYDLKYNLPEFGKFETIIGIQGMFQKNENFGEEILIPDATISDFGVLGTTHYHLEKVDLQAGLRYDLRNLSSEAYGMLGTSEYIAALDREFSSFNAAIGGKFDLFSELNARLNLATGFRAPNLAELTSNGVHEGTNRYEIGNPNLNNEQNFQLDLAVEYGNEHLELFANGFHNWIRDYIFIQPTGSVIDDNLVYDYIQGDSKLYGGEFGMHLHPHPLDWMHIESSFQIVTGELKNGQDLPLIPANTLRSTLNIDFKEGKILAKSGAFITLLNVLDQDRVSEFETRTGGYSLLHLGCNGNLVFNGWDLNINLAVSNLLDRSYVSHLSRLKTDGIPNIGRNFSISVSAGI